jgi:hypothetical protein
MRKKLLPIGLLLFAIVALSGCSTVYVPAPGTADYKKIPDLPPGTTVALVNAQPANDVILIGKVSSGTFNGNLHVWTDRLIQSMKETLKKKHVDVNDQSSKVLQVSIEEAKLKMVAGGWGFGCDLSWKVVTGVGTTLTLTNEISHWKAEDASNVAVRDACLRTLQNDQVQKYLSGK